MWVWVWVWGLEKYSALSGFKALPCDAPDAVIRVVSRSPSGSPGYSRWGYMVRTHTSTPIARWRLSQWIEVVGFFGFDCGGLVDSSRFAFSMEKRARRQDSDARGAKRHLLLASGGEKKQKNYEFEFMALILKRSQIKNKIIHLFVDITTDLKN